jgi:leader peptidase (prepilin peptidase)/N-methyltransferase
MTGLDVIPPNVVRAVGACAGLGGGFVAGLLADRLPRRYDITLLVSGAERRRRNIALVAILGAIGGWLAHYVTGVANAPLDQALLYFATNLLLAVALVAAAAIDLEHMILPNELTLGGAVVALATAHWRGAGLVGALIGAAVGLALTYLPFVLYKRLRGRSGMGLGDAKLALVAGAWLGAPGAIFVVFAGALQSALAAAMMRVLGITFAVPASVQAELAALRAKAEAGDEEARAILADDPMAGDVGKPAHGEPEKSKSQGVMHMRLPMGPFLVLACLEFVVARREILMLFDRYISPP